MATNTAGSTARQHYTQQPSYIARKITHLDAGTTVTVGTLPAGAQIVKAISGVAVNVAFNGSTTNTVSIGPSSDPGTDLWATALATGAIGFVPLDEVVSNEVLVDTPVSAAVVATASPSAGSAVIMIHYIVPTN